MLNKHLFIIQIHATFPLLLAALTSLLSCTRCVKTAQRGRNALKLADFSMESGCPRGQHVLFGRRTKFRAATGPTHQGLLILQRPLVRPVPCHGSAAEAAAASLWSGDLSRLCCSASTGKPRRRLSVLSVPVRLLKSSGRPECLCGSSRRKLRLQSESRLQ